MSLLFGTVHTRCSCWNVLLLSSPHGQELTRKSGCRMLPIDLILTSILFINSTSPIFFHSHSLYSWLELNYFHLYSNSSSIMLYLSFEFNSADYVYAIFLLLIVHWYRNGVQLPAKVRQPCKSLNSLVLNVVKHWLYLYIYFLYIW